MNVPFPNDVAFPVNFDEYVIEELFVRDLVVMNGFMAEDQGVTAVGLAFHARNVVTNWVAFTLIVMMLTSHPHSWLAFIFDVFFVVEFPNNVTIPVELSQVGLVLIGERAVANAEGTKYIAALQELVREALEVFPNLDNVTVHVDQNGTDFADWHQGVATPGFFWIINRSTGRIDG